MARKDISYDYEDFGMSVQQLMQKYENPETREGEHPEHTVANYHSSGSQSNANYWDWVVRQIRADDESIEGAPEPSSDTYEERTPIPTRQAKVVEDMDQLALLFAKWHKLGNQKAQNMYDMPEGHAVEFTPGDGQEPIEMILEGEKYQAFRMGIMAAVECFGPLPFTYSIEEAEAIPESKDGPAQSV